MRKLTLLSCAGAALMAVISAPTSVKADTISATLGSAGPADWAILTGPNSVTALNGPGTTNGNVGINNTAAGALQLNSSNPFAIVGNVFLAGGSSTITHPSEVNGTITPNSTLPGTAWANVAGASTSFDALPANQTFASGITGNTTINATGSVYVVDVTGDINLPQNDVLTVHGSASTDVIINVTGTLSLHGNQSLNPALALSGGITADHVVYNFVGSGSALSTSGGLNQESIADGILLAPQRDVGFAPGEVNGELIAGGTNIQIVSGGSVNQPPVGGPLPLPASVSGGAALLSILASWRLIRRHQAVNA